METDDARTIWCGNISDKVTEDILYELFLQGGPLQKVNIPKDRDGKQKNFGFVTYKHLSSVQYALDLFEGTCLYNRPLNLKNRNSNSSGDNNSAQYFQQMQQANMFDNAQLQNFQNQLQMGQQVMLGNQISNFNAFNMMPGCVSYSSQSNDYSQNPQSLDHGRSRDRERDRDRNNRHNRHHPYQNRDRHDDRQNGRQDSYNRDHKSYRHSSHRSNRHDNRRKY